MTGSPDDLPKPPATPAVPPVPAVPPLPGAESYPAIPRKIERPQPKDAPAPAAAQPAVAAQPAPAAPPAAAPKEPPKPVQPALGELFELSLTSLINASGVFARLGARPLPGPGASFVVALGWGVLFFALNLSHLVITNADALRAYQPWQIGAVGACGLVLWSALYLLGSSVIYGLGRTLGSGGDFDRALLVAAVALAAAPAQALCSFYPAAWFLPAIIGAWIAATGLSELFKTNAWAARGVCALLASAALALQYGAGLAVARYAAAAQLAAGAAQAAPQLAELQQQMQKQMGEIQALSDENAALPGATGQSSLDLLRGPAGEEVAADAPAAPQQKRIEKIAAKGEAMNKTAIGMLDSLGPLLNNPAIQANMTAAQKADFAELNREIATMKSGGGAGMTPAENQARMLKIQGLVMRMMSAGMPAGVPKPNLPRIEPPKANQP